MSKLPLGSVFKIILKKKTSLRFLTGTIASFSFSIAVILSTIGLMDGYVVTLKEALAKSNGDIKFTSPESFFLDECHLFKSSQDIEAYTTLLQLESFALINEQSKGVLLKGIDQEKFKRVTGINTEKLGETGVLLGSQLQKHFDLKVGEQITLAVASGKAKNQGSVLLRSFTIKGIVDHGIFEKDLRFIYANKSTVSNLLDYKD